MISAASFPNCEAIMGPTTDTSFWGVVQYIVAPNLPTGGFVVAAMSAERPVERGEGDCGVPAEEPPVPPPAPGVTVELSLPLIRRILANMVVVETTVEDC